jgi:hypothetical protein
MTTLDSIQTILADDEAPSINKKRSTTCFQPDEYFRNSPEFDEATEYQVNLASAISQTLREDLRSVIPYPSSPVMHDQMKRTLTEYVQWGTIDPENWTSHLWRVQYINFTRRSFSGTNPWGSSLKIKRISPQLVHIKIPAFIPKVVFDTDSRIESVKCKIAMSVLYPQTGASVASGETEFEFPCDYSRVRTMLISAELPTPKMSILVTGLMLEFETNHKYVLTNKEKGNYVRASIINAIGV